jgi:geranylgeranyl pyrophosphate synthase
MENHCRATFDEFGLLCRQCGQCSIQDLQAEAERLGYAVLVAEGSAVVTSLIQTGKIDAIIGVSCLNVLERAFPFMEAAAVPGVAVPLLQDDCANTSVDLAWVWDYLHLTSADRTRRLDLSALRDEVEQWFKPASLDSIMGAVQGETESLARHWLAGPGKRWRPFLAVAAFQALHPEIGGALPEALREVAVAVECFHKASLIHDDIEDNDLFRYGQKTLHAEHGLAVALNVGDLLIGEGYRLLAGSRWPAEAKSRMLQVAAAGQRQLCRGQGAELCWNCRPHPLRAAEVIDIFRQKTAPAFEVALRLGALCADPERHEQISPALAAYSEALGIAYQIRDDLEDWDSQVQGSDRLAFRPSLLLAVAHERAPEQQKAWLEALWRRQPPTEASAEQVERLLQQVKSEERVRALLEAYKREAIRALQQLDNASLKGLLRRVIGKIFNEPEIRGWCKEFAPGNGARVPAQA